MTKTIQEDEHSRRNAYLTAYVFTLLAALFAYGIWANRNVDLWRLAAEHHYYVLNDNTFSSVAVR